jgi:hypothetical protein
MKKNSFIVGFVLVLAVLLVGYLAESDPVQADNNQAYGRLLERQIRAEERQAKALENIAGEIKSFKNKMRGY